MGWLKNPLFLATIDNLKGHAWVIIGAPPLHKIPPLDQQVVIGQCFKAKAPFD